MRTPLPLSRLALASAAGLVLTLAGTAIGGENKFVDKATELGSATPGTVAADETLFPALANMDTPPMPVGMGADLDAILMLSPGDDDWAKMEMWATKPAQQEVIKALATITDQGHKEPWLLSIPFGWDDSDPDRVDAGLWIELPTDALLSSAKYHYLDKVESANALALFEGMRLASEGEGDEALDVMVNLLRFGRMLAERPSTTEVKAAYSIMRIASERTRDIVFAYPKAYSVDGLTLAAEAFDERRLRPRMMPMPKIEELSAQQLLARTFEERGDVKPGVYAQTFAMLEADDRPLRRLSEAARYRDSADTQDDWWDQGDAIENVFGDFKARWRIPGYKDPLFNKTTIFEQTDGKARKLVLYAAEGLTDLMGVRNTLEIDLGGTMNALGVVAFEKDQGKLPPTLPAIEPMYVSRMKTDPNNENPRYDNNVFFDYPYWVPIRDQEFDRRVQPHPYDIEVVLPGEGESLFAVEPPKTGSADAVLRSLTLKQPAVQRLVGKPAPKFELSNWHKGDPITLDNSAGDIRVIVFWATWCGPCKAAIPGNNEVFEKYKDQGVTMFGICDNKSGGDSMGRTADQHDMAYPTGLDTDGDATSNFKLPHWPYIVIVDRTDTIRCAGVSPYQLDKAVAALLKEQPLGWTDETSVAASGVDLSNIDMSMFEGVPGMEDFTDFDPSDMADKTLREFYEDLGLPVPSNMDEDLLNKTMSELESMNPEKLMAAIGMEGMDPAMFKDFMPGAADGRSAANSFTVSLDDSTFLLYSVGTNGVDDKAKKVGAGGDDVLIWPPLMSLSRKHMHGEF